jgi:Flp pilus assembly protein TadG
VKLLARRKIKRNGRGQVFALLAILIPMLLILVGFGIDFGLAYVTKTTLSKSVDAAALAAMRNLNQGETVATADAKNAFTVNYQSVPGLGTTPTPTITWFTTSPCISGNTCVTISATATISTYFLRVLGVLPGVGSSLNSTSITVSATAQRNPLVMSLILDRSGSMNNNGGAQALPPAVTDFIGYFDQGVDNVAEISFAGADSLDVAMTEEFVTPITNAVEGMVFQGGTFAQGGLQEGDTEILTIPATPNIIRVAVFFTDGWANTVNDNLNCTGTVKAPVLTNWNYGGCADVVGGPVECSTVFFMNPSTGDWTDGRPPFGGSDNTCPNVTGRPGTFPAQKPGLSDVTNAVDITQDATYRTLQLATKMRTTDNVTIYSIGLGSLINQEYLLEIANDPSADTYNSSQPQGEAVFAPNASQLDAVFQTIASKVLLRLSQ